MSCFTKIKNHPILGYETKQRVEAASERKFSKNPVGIDVTLKVIAYIPGLNIIVGVGRIIFALKMKSVNDPERVRIRRVQIVRGLIEIFGFCVVPMALDFTKAAIQGVVIALQQHNQND